jgi:sirohydrochlorin cobaltochelatase
VVLLIAHGSRNPRAAQEHAVLCEAVQQRCAESGFPVPVRPAYLELATPSIPDEIDRAVLDGATVVRLLPHFLSSGNHVMVDLPEIAAAARERHPEVTIDLAAHLGSDPGMVDLVASRVSG